MWPDEAASEAQATWASFFSHFDSPVPWYEVRENITKGGVAGSGYGYTLLHAFVKQGNELAVRLLLYKGADINAKTRSDGYTPLHVAIATRNLALVSLLLDNGADAFAQDSKEMTPWALAISHGNEEIVAALVAQGINVNGLARGGSTPAKPLMLAIEYGKEKVVDLLIKCGGQIEAMDGNGNTALIKAVANEKRVEIVRRLLEAGANVNASNNHGVTALMVAAKGGSEQMVQALLDKRPNLEARSDDGESALLIASREGFTSIVQLLLECGAECVLGYPRGSTPQDVAAGFQIIELLQQARTKKKKWFQRFNNDTMDERYQSARLAEIYKVHEEREKRERREFSYVQTEEDVAEEEQREMEMIQRRMRLQAAKKL
jgi:ankyrin repeat protein